MAGERQSRSVDYGWLEFRQSYETIVKAAEKRIARLLNKLNKDNFPVDNGVWEDRFATKCGGVIFRLSREEIASSPPEFQRTLADIGINPELDSVRFTLLESLDRFQIQIMPEGIDRDNFGIELLSSQGGYSYPPNGVLIGPIHVESNLRDKDGNYQGRSAQVKEAYSYPDGILNHPFMPVLIVSMLEFATDLIEKKLKKNEPIIPQENQGIRRGLLGTLLHANRTTR